MYFIIYRNAGKTHVKLHDGNNLIPQIREINNNAINRNEVIRIELSHQRINEVQQMRENQINNDLEI